MWKIQVGIKETKRSWIPANQENPWNEPACYSCICPSQVWDACSEARLVFNNQTSHDFGTIAEGVSQDQEEAVAEDIIGSGYRSSAQDVTSDDIMGYIVENKVIMAALLGVLEDCTNVEVWRGVKTLEVQPSAANCKVSHWFSGWMSTSVKKDIEIQPEFNLAHNLQY